MMHFNTQTSVKSKSIRLFKAMLSPFLKYVFLSGFIYVVKLNLNTFFCGYFDLTLEKQKMDILKKYTAKASENLSLLSPTKISEYVSSLANSALAQAKVTTIEKTVGFLTSFFDTILFLILIYFAYAFVRDMFSSFKEKERENDIANLVVEKLLPLLKNDLK